MEKSVATGEPTAEHPEVRPNELTPELIKLVEEAQAPCFPGCKYTVHKFINELMDMQPSKPNETDRCIREIVWLYIPLMPKGGRIWEIADKIDKLVHAYTLIRSQKSPGVNAESSNKAASPASSANKSLRVLPREDDPQVQQSFQQTIISAQQSELVPNATRGNEFLRDSIEGGDPQWQQNSRRTLMLFPHATL